MHTIDDLLSILKQNDVQGDTAKIRQAYEIAEAAHRGQLRKSGEPYISHPVEVAVILAGLGMDTDTVVAALLHDVVEDTAMKLETLRKQFGPEVAHLVDGVTKLSKISFSSREEHQAENIRKMLIAMVGDVRVIIIKLADRLHNMRTMEHMDEQKQRDKALETMEVFAPIAHRLGISAIKDELEDISLVYLDPIAYNEIVSLLQSDRAERERVLGIIINRISERLVGNNYENLSIEGRVKSMYSIYRKIYIQGRPYDDIFDIYAVRILVGTVNECYNVLGEIHDLFRPIPHRFKDYISTPKPNMYQSLHTTVFDKNTTPFEVQIRTWDMHLTAEYGIASHWKYKEGIKGKDLLEDKILWARQLLESQKDSVDVQDILGSIKSDLNPDEVYPFTPKGDVIALPSGASVIDFAYAIHTQVGNSMIGAKIDGRMVSLDTQVQTGQIVNILTTNAKDHGPSRDWINIVKTSSTRSKIRAWFKRERREENITQGRAELEKEFRRNGILLDEKEMEAFLARLARNQRLNTTEEFLAALGYGGISLSKIMPRIKELYTKLYKESESAEKLIKKQLEKTAAKKEKTASSGVIVEGLDNCLVKFSRCCAPLPGDQIIGFITRGYGVSIHKRDCVNVENHSSQPERWVNCEWSESPIEETFKSTVDIYSKDRDDLLVDVATALKNMRVPIYALIAREHPQSGAAIQITFGIRNVDQLNNITKTLCKIQGVERIERATQ